MEYLLIAGAGVTSSYNGNWSYNNMMNEIVLEIQELEDAVDKLKLVDAPEAFVAIRTIDVMIERKRSQLEAFERTANET